MSDRCACQKCGWEGPISEADECRDIWSRLEAGDEVPAGDCPECGAFALLVKPDRDLCNDAQVSLIAILAAGDALCRVLEDAESQHIYDFDNGDRQPEDCAFRSAREAWGGARAGVSTGNRVIVVEVEGGCASVFSPQAAPDLCFMVVDLDASAADSNEQARLPGQPEWRPATVGYRAAVLRPLIETRSVRPNPPTWLVRARFCGRSGRPETWAGEIPAGESTDAPVAAARALIDAAYPGATKVDMTFTSPKWDR